MRRRPLAFVFVSALAVGACGGDDGRAARDETTPSSTTTTASISTSSTTTTASISTGSTARPGGDLPCPRALEPLARVDLDGDGRDEVLTVEEVPSGGLLAICGPAGPPRTLELGLGVWYVVVTDVEPDGTDEVFVGAPSVGDGPDQLEAKFFWLDPRAAELRLHTDDFAGVWVSGSGGAACVDVDPDVDDDGARELVAIAVDDSRSTPETVVWRRSIANARPFEHDGVDQPIDFTLARADGAYPSLFVFSCGGEILEPVRVPPPAAICDDAAPSVRVDVDGDGRDDVVAQRFGESLLGPGPSIVVCTAAGVVEEALVGGMGEIFAVSTASGDRPTIWAGGTTVSAAFLEPYTMVGDRLVAIADDRGPIGFSEGFLSPDEVALFGCADLDGDGRIELVQVEGARDGGDIVWTRRSWETEGARATLVSETAGRLDRSTTAEPDELPLREYPEGFEPLLPVGDCGYVDSN